MQLYLIRHAIAVRSDSPIVTADGGRALTEVGAKKMRDIARALKRMGVIFDVVLTSPLVRAYQTAEIVCEVLKCPDRIERSDALAPGCDIDLLADALRKHESATAVALVGHNPDFEDLAAAIVVGSPEAGIIFKKGGVCRIDLDRLDPQPSGNLIWHLTPKLLRMLAK